MGPLISGYEGSVSYFYPYFAQFSDIFQDIRCIYVAE